MSRVAFDAYQTPDNVAVVCVRTLVDRGLLRPAHTVIEPSCGTGSFIRAMRPHVARIHAVDVDPAVRISIGSDYADSGFIEDFAETTKTADWVIGNPPYKHAAEHTGHALKLAPRVAFLLRLSFLESESRRSFWAMHPPAEVHVLCRRPSFTGGGTDYMSYGWFVWLDGCIAPPILRWM